MAVTNTPVFTQSILDSLVQVSVANTARDGTGTLSAAVVVGSNGGFVDYVRFMAIVTTTAGSLRIFHWDGALARLLDEIVTTGVTPSGTLAAESHTWIPPGGIPLKLAANNGLKFCTNNAETWNCLAVGENY